MKGLRCFRFLLLFVPLVFILFLAGQGAPGLVHAQKLEFGDFACWATGPFPDSPPDERDLSLDNEVKWGRIADEFVVDLRDLGNDVILPAGLRAEYLGGNHAPQSDSEEEPVYTLFGSLPELSEYIFALDVLSDGLDDDRSISDRRVRRLLDRIGSDPHTPIFGEERRYLLPWDTREDYLKRRRVAVPYKNAVQSFYGQWIDPANPGGGRVVDYVDLARDQAANRLEALEGTVTAAGDGGVVHYGTMEAVAQEFTFQSDEDCSGSSCRSVTTMSSELVPVTFHTSVREQNDGQTYRNVTEAGDRVVRVTDPGASDDETNPDVLHPGQHVEFDLSYLPPSTLHLRDPGSGGYYRRHQENTGSDQLHITLVLQDRYRRDFNFDPDSGALYGERGLPVMGFNPWTYDSIRIGNSDVRDPDVNESAGVLGAYAHDDPDRHHGYRQPRLSRVYDGDNITVVRDDKPESIRWPVNLEDLNWYLYRLPATEYRDPLWLYWVSDDGRLRLVNSAYGHEPIPLPADPDLGALLDEDGDVDDGIPTCSLPGEGRDYPAAGYHVPLNIEAIDCADTDHLLDWDVLWKGEQRGVVLPFDSPGESPDHLLGDRLLVKQGVESAEDSGDPIGTRRLNRFDFLIYESERMGDLPPGEKGYDAERRYGFPRNAERRDEYVGDWAFEPVDPNMPHLLVVTFYEAKIDEDLADFKVGDDDGHVESYAFSLPKRRLQRVICRMFVHPSGNWPGESMVKWLSENLFGKVKTFFTEKFVEFSGWLSSLFRGVAEAPLGVARKTTGLVCAGVGKLDELTEEDGAGGQASPSLVDEEGRVRLNAALRSKQEGEEHCHRVSAPPVSTCERSSDAIFEGACLRLPEMRLQVRDAEFVRPPPSGVAYREYVTLLSGVGSSNYGERGLAAISPAFTFGRPEFSSVDSALADPSGITARSVGLTRVFLDWDFRWGGVSSEVHRVIDGFMVFVYPDRKSSHTEVPDGGFPFALPKYAFAEAGLEDGTQTRYFPVKGFSVGALYEYPSTSTRARESSDSLVSVLDSWDELGAVGIKRVRDDYESFNNLIHNMPLAPGFVHGFEVAPYVGRPGSPEFRLGPRSEKIELNGNHVACDEVTEPEQDVRDIRKLYDCGPPVARVSLGYDDDEFRPGLLAMTGTDICTDIFSSTPAGFTWDNPVVKQVWRLVWIIAGAVLFTLLVWQGLRMTYDVWLVPQPAVGFRELVPRFLLAAGLAASSLVICRMVLVIASDLTCFVAQVTGMSMWGVIGATFGVLMEGFVSWVQGLLAEDASLLEVLGNFLLVALSGTIVTLVLLFLLYLFLKVLLGMLLRIGLLAVLIALSPLAFAFYASEATSHWTRKWVSMFLGTTFQQVVVLVVIYLGINIMRHYLTAGVESGLTDMVVGMILAFVTLSLAASVPDIVNPGGKGVFSALNQMGMMAMAGAAVVTGGVIGAAAAGIGGIGGIGGATGAGVNLSSTGAGASGSSGVGLSTLAGGAPGSAAGGGPDNLVSSVNRSSTGPGSGPPTGGVSPAAPSPAPGSPPSSAPAPGGPSSAAPAQASGGPGFFRRIAEGYMRGARRGARFNTRVADLMSGNMFFSHGSRGDDAARQIEQQREEQSEDRARARESYDRLSEVLGRLDQRLGGSP